jgi:hypothetical protein
MPQVRGGMLAGPLQIIPRRAARVHTHANSPAAQFARMPSSKCQQLAYSHRI